MGYQLYPYIYTYGRQVNVSYTRTLPYPTTYMKSSSSHPSVLLLPIPPLPFPFPFPRPPSPSSSSSPSPYSSPPTPSIRSLYAFSLFSFSSLRILTSRSSFWIRSRFSLLSTARCAFKCSSRAAGKSSVGVMVRVLVRRFMVELRRVGRRVFLVWGLGGGVG